MNSFEHLSLDLLLPFGQEHGGKLFPELVHHFVDTAIIQHINIAGILLNSRFKWFVSFDNFHYVRILYRV